MRVKRRRQRRILWEENGRKAPNPAGYAGGNARLEAFVLTYGTESNYRDLMFQQYGTKAPEMNEIAGYFDQRFNDQNTLNWLKLKHPATPPKLDVEGIAMMALAPEFESAAEAAGAGSKEASHWFAHFNRLYF